MLAAILDECKQDLSSKGILQWDDTYPNEAYFLEKVAEKHLYAILYGMEIIGAFVADNWQSPEWANVQWSCKEGVFLVVHSLFVHPCHQGAGAGNAAMAYIEALARQNRCDGIRLDVFSKNNAALSFYEKLGYIKRGEVFFPSKPAHNEIYSCYDKMLHHYAE